MTLRVGRYETLRAIASGGMATVYLGRALGAGGFERLVAIKVMHAHTAADPEFVAMFLDEARLAARVRHPNVVATIDLVEDPLFLVMEYIEGPTLHAMLRECRKAKRPFPIGVGLRIFLDMLSGLHAAHELTGHGGERLNLVHRDVSPQNVLVGADGVSRITDFGVARAESRISSTQGHTLKGKIAYMSPEQIQGKPVDRRSDIYAAGVVLWEVLTERRLFRADNEGALIAQILAGPQRGPRSVAQGVPAALDRVCMKALRADPRDRFPTAAAFADAIEQAMAATPGVTIASNRAVAALVKWLGLHATPEDLATPPIASPHSNVLELPPPSSPSGLRETVPLVATAAPPSEEPRSSVSSASASSSVSSASALSAASSASAASSVSSAAIPASGATGVGVVSEPRFRARSGYRGVLAAMGAVVVVALAIGAGIMTVRMRSQPATEKTVSAAPPMQGAATPAPENVAAPEQPAVAAAEDLRPPPADPPDPPKTRSDAPAAADTGGAPREAPVAKTTGRRTAAPPATGSRTAPRGGGTAKPTGTNFRPTEL